MKPEQTVDNIVEKIVNLGASDLMKHSMQYFMQVEWSDKYELMRKTLLAIKSRAARQLEEWILEDQKNNPQK